MTTPADGQDPPHPPAPYAPEICPSPRASSRGHILRPPSYQSPPNEGAAPDLHSCPLASHTHLSAYIHAHASAHSRVQRSTWTHTHVSRHVSPLSLSHTHVQNCKPGHAYTHAWNRHVRPQSPTERTSMHKHTHTHVHTLPHPATISLHSRAGPEGSRCRTLPSAPARTPPLTATPNPAPTPAPCLGPTAPPTTHGQTQPGPPRVPVPSSQLLLPSGMRLALGWDVPAAK